jgi:N-acetylmuramoyl-L-alanine amidase
VTRSRLAAALVALPTLALAAAPEPVILLTEGQRREIAVTTRGEAELLPLGPLIAGLGVASRSNAVTGSMTLSYQGREATVYHKKSLASVGGDLHLLSSPSLLENGQWLIPVDAVPRLLGALLGVRSEWRPASRILVLGNVPAPRITVSTFVSGEAVRVVFESSEKVPFRVSREAGKVNVAIVRDLVETSFTQQRLTGGIVDWVQWAGGRENLFAITTGRRFGEFAYQEQEAPSRLVLDFKAANVGVGPNPKETAPAPAAASGEASPLRSVVIDPGHGGEEVGALGPGGAMEKDVTLSIARKLRALVQNNLGYQVFLTRDKDDAVALDERTAVANNYKADLFVSIHANASRAKGAHGSEVYFLSYQASDDDARRAAQAEGAALAPPDAPPLGAELSLILWDMAQAEHLEESSALASRIQEELAGVTGSEGRGIKQAPFRVLVGAAMPAVLVEVAFISNAEEEKDLVSEPFQAKLASALLRGIARYENEHGRVAPVGRAPAGTP